MKRTKQETHALATVIEHWALSVIVAGSLIYGVSCGIATLF